MGLLCQRKRIRSLNLRGTAKETLFFLQSWAADAHDMVRPNTNNVAKLQQC